MEFISDVSSGSDRYAPSFFELAAQEQLRDLLQPVVRYLLSVLATRYPRYFLRFSNRHEETYAGLMLLIERHYLTQWDSSFAENFYGLKRRRRPGVTSERAQSAVDLFTDHQKLRATEKRWSLFFLIAVPYLRSKAEQLCDQSGGSDGQVLFQDREGDIAPLQPLTPLNALWARLLDAFRRAWPHINTGYESLLLAYNVGYLFDRTPYHRPWLHWLGVDIRRMSEQDYRQASIARTSLRGKLMQTDSAGRSPSILRVLSRLLLLSPRYFLEALKVLLPTSIFFFKFLEWWYSSSYARSRLMSAKSDSAQPAIRAPSGQVQPHLDGTLGATGLSGLAKGACPVCKQAITNPTALPTGWVGDYRCLYNYVEEHGRCPVTRLPVAGGDLRKIMG